MKLSEIMTPEVVTIDPDASLHEAAQIMASLEIGMLPVTIGDELLGVITDRDITVRSAARGLNPHRRRDQRRNHGTHPAAGYGTAPWRRTASFPGLRLRPGAQTGPALRADRRARRSSKFSAGRWLCAPRNCMTTA